MSKKEMIWANSAETIERRREDFKTRYEGPVKLAMSAMDAANHAMPIPAIHFSVQLAPDEARIPTSIFLNGFFQAGVSGENLVRRGADSGQWVRMPATAANMEIPAEDYVSGLEKELDGIRKKSKESGAHPALATGIPALDQIVREWKDGNLPKFLTESYESQQPRSIRSVPQAVSGFAHS